MATRTERAAGRFSDSLEQLQITLAEHGLTSGSPENLVEAAHALVSSDAVREQMTMTLRQELTRSGGAMSRAELATLLVVAVGGSYRYETAEQVDSVVALDSFVDEVMTDWEQRKVRLAPEVDGAGAAGSFCTNVSPDEAASVEKIASEADDESRTATAQSQDRVAEAVEPFRGGGLSPGFPAGEPRIRFRAQDETGQPFFPTSPSGRGGRTGIAAVFVAALLAVAGFGGRSLWRHLQSAQTPQTTRAAAPELPHGLPAQRSDPIASPTPPAAASAELVQAKSGSASTPRDATQSRTPSAPASNRGILKDESPGSTSASQQKTIQGPGTTRPGFVALPATRSGALSDGVVGDMVARGGPVSPSGRFLVSSGVMANHLLAAPEPAYPKMAKLWRVQGEVILQAVVSRKGQVVSARVLDGHHLLRGAATDAVRKWRYRPYAVHGKPMDVDTVVIVNFHLPS